LAKSKASVPAYISNKHQDKAALNIREEQHKGNRLKNRFHSNTYEFSQPCASPFSVSNYQNTVPTCESSMIIVSCMPVLQQLQQH
jgi:hypothetical protein